MATNLVFSGKYVEFRNFVFEKGLTDEKTHYITEPRHLLGIHDPKGVNLYFIGFWMKTWTGLTLVRSMADVINCNVRMDQYVESPNLARAWIHGSPYEQQVLRYLGLYEAEIEQSFEPEPVVQYVRKFKLA